MATGRTVMPAVRRDRRVPAVVRPAEAIPRATSRITTYTPNFRRHLPKAMQVCPVLGSDIRRRVARIGPVAANVRSAGRDADR